MKYTLGITMMSNRPDMAAERWLQSVSKLKPLHKHFTVGYSFVVEEPFTDVKEYKKLGKVTTVKKRNAIRFNWWPDRNKACEQIDAKYWLMTDDDCQFGGPTPLGYESWKRYADGIMYMEAHPDCGAVLCLPFLGGSVAKEAIMLANHDLFALG